VARQLGSLFEDGSAAGWSDRQLLERYIAGGRDQAGEAAFGALVGRHGPMVLGVCQQLLGDVQHAEDAFQAVFLVLAQKARSIRDPDLLGNWLYGVALRTARCTRQQIARRGRREEGDTMRGPGAGSCVAAEPTAPPADRSVIDREQAQAIHGEVDRLPRAFRLPVVLCYFEGLTLDEAARRLRCPAGTLRSRLARAREKLRISLASRGVALPAAVLTAVLAPRSASASIPPLLCDSTTRSAIQFAGRHAGVSGALSAPVAALAREVLRTMLLQKLKLTVMSLLLLAAVATGAGWLTRSMAMKEKPMKEPAVPATQVTPRVADQRRPQTKPDRSARMTVAGRVLDPEGKPVHGAVVDVVARPRAPLTGASVELSASALLGQGQSDGDGRYRLDASRTASNRVFEVFALAAAPGYGLGWAALNPDADQPGADIRLLPEQPVCVRLVDVTGTPAKLVEVRVQSIGRPSDNGLFDGVTLWANPPHGMRTWPRPVTTDDQGRTTVPGIGRGLRVFLTVRDSRFAWQDLQVDTIRPTGDKGNTMALQPARIIAGRVLAADTGRPIPNAVISVAASRDELGSMFTTRFRADDQGRFTANPSPGDYFRVTAYAPDGQPYVVPHVQFAWTKGTVKKVMDISLPRGVAIRGKVTDAETGRPLPASSIQFIAVRGRDDVLSGWQAIVASTGDGSFQIAVPPGKGHLLIFGPTDDYVLAEIGFNRLYNDRPGGQRYHAHAIIPYEVKAGDLPHELAVPLRPGVTIKGRVEGPSGETITDAFVLTTLRIEPFNPHWRGDYQIKVRDGRFELHGLAPDASTRIHVLDPEHEWGATVEVSGKQAGEDVTVRLQTCGKARARFVGPDGRPIAKLWPTFEFVATPGPYHLSRKKQDQAELASDAELVANVDRKHYWNDPGTDAEGRYSMTSLIPGALYRILDFSTVNDQNKGAQIRKDFTVKPGETLDLGDILIEKPQEQ